MWRRFVPDEITPVNYNFVNAKKLGAKEGKVISIKVKSIKAGFLNHIYCLTIK